MSVKRSSLSVVALLKNVGSLCCVQFSNAEECLEACKDACRLLSNFWECPFSMLWINEGFAEEDIDLDTVNICSVFHTSAVTNQNAFDIRKFAQIQLGSYVSNKNPVMLSMKNIEVVFTENISEYEMVNNVAKLFILLILVELLKSHPPPLASISLI